MIVLHCFLLKKFLLGSNINIIACFTWGTEQTTSFLKTHGLLQRKSFVGMVYIDETVFGIIFVPLNHLNPITGGLAMD